MRNVWLGTLHRELQFPHRNRFRKTSEKQRTHVQYNTQASSCAVLFIRRKKNNPYASYLDRNFFGFFGFMEKLSFLMLHGKLIREHLGPNADPKHSSSDLETLLSKARARGTFRLAGDHKI